MSHNETINAYGYVQSKFAGKLSICFFASNQTLATILVKIVQFMWHVYQQAVQVQCTFLLCHLNKQLVIDCHWRNTLEQYYIQIWYIFMHRIMGQHAPVVVISLFFNIDKKLGSRFPKSGEYVAKTRTCYIGLYMLRNSTFKHGVCGTQKKGANSPRSPLLYYCTLAFLLIDM